MFLVFLAWEGKWEMDIFLKRILIFQAKDQGIFGSILLKNDDFMVVLEVVFGKKGDRLIEL